MRARSAVDACQPVELASQVVGIERTSGRVVLVPQTGGPPTRIDGHTIGVVSVSGEPPHGGEVHPDGDELLYVISGRINVHLELDTGDQDIELAPGQAQVVPRGVWHQITTIETAQLLHITPGPGGQARPRRDV